MAIYHPVRPNPLTLAQITYLACASDKVCLTRADAKAELQNRLKVGKWMGEMDNIVDYYEGITTPKPAKDPTSGTVSP